MRVDFLNLTVFSDLRGLLLLGSLEKNGESFFPIFVDRDIDYGSIISIPHITLSLL